MYIPEVSKFMNYAEHAMAIYIFKYCNIQFINNKNLMKVYNLILNVTNKVSTENEFINILLNLGVGFFF